MSEAAKYSGLPDVGISHEDRQAQERFIQENLRRIFLQIYRIVGNVDDAQDLTQETFIKALQRQEQIKDLEKAAHWLSRIASNTAIDFLRRHGRVNFSDIDEIVEPLRTDAEHSPEQPLAAGRAGRVSRRRSAAPERSRTLGASAPRRGRLTRRRSRTGIELLEGDRPIAYRECADQVPAVSGTEEGMMASATDRIRRVELALYSSGDLNARRAIASPAACPVRAPDARHKSNRCNVTSSRLRSQIDEVAARRAVGPSRG